MMNENKTICTMKKRFAFSRLKINTINTISIVLPFLLVTMGVAKILYSIKRSTFHGGTLFAWSAAITLLLAIVVLVWYVYKDDKRHKKNSNT
jgi:uncharacterized membrane protein HdeD (DUF308 family)